MGNKELYIWLRWIEIPHIRLENNDQMDVKEMVLCLFPARHRN